MIRRWLQRILGIPSPSQIDTARWPDADGWTSRTDSPDTPGPVSTGPPPEV